MIDRRSTFSWDWKKVATYSMTYLLGSVLSRSASLYSAEAIEVSRCPLSMVLICCSYPEISKKIVVRQKL